jgi:hypothetical protein
LKAWLGGQRFAANDELQDAVKTYLSSLAATSLQKASRSLCHDMTNASTVLAIM